MFVLRLEILFLILYVPGSNLVEASCYDWGNSVFFIFCIQCGCTVQVKKCVLVQALRLYIGRTAHRGSTVIALLFLDHGTRRRVRGQRHAPSALYPRERPGILFTGGWVDPRASLDGCGKSRPHRDSVPGSSSP